MTEQLGKLIRVGLWSLAGAIGAQGVVSEDAVTIAGNVIAALLIAGGTYAWSLWRDKRIKGTKS